MTTVPVLEQVSALSLVPPIDVAILYAMFRKGEDVADQGVEEVYRRQLVALARQAGTNIRKEELKRQALSAQINLPGAIAAQETIRNAIRVISPREYRGRLETMTLDDLGEHFMGWLGKVLLAAMSGLPLARLQGTLASLNEYIKVHNRIVGDLASERIYLAAIPEVPIPTDYLSAASA